MDNQHANMSFWEHLDEFRNRLFIVLFSVIIGSIISYYYSETILEILLYPSKQHSNISFQVITVTSMFMINLGISLFGGLVIGFPVLIFHIINFLLPAINSSTVKVIFLAILSSMFFCLGVLFSYSIVIPFLLSFFTSISFQAVTVDYNFTLGSYINYTLWTIFINGIVFQMPIIAIIGAKAGLLTPAFLRHYRGHSFIGFLVISALITPPDPFSQLLICVPFVILYELSIIFSGFIKK